MKFPTGILLIIVISLLMSNCKRVVSTDDLKTVVLSYDQLPDSVKLLFVNAKEYTKISGSSNLLYSESVIGYEMNTAKSIGSFIDYYEISNDQGEHIVRIPYGKKLPFAIHKDILYIPTVHDVGNNLMKAGKARYETYRID